MMFQVAITGGKEFTTSGIMPVMTSPMPLKQAPHGADLPQKFPVVGELVGHVDSELR